jgi:hypothetical protein
VSHWVQILHSPGSKRQVTSALTLPSLLVPARLTAPRPCEFRQVVTPLHALPMPKIGSVLPAWHAERPPSLLILAASSVSPTAGCTVSTVSPPFPVGANIGCTKRPPDKPPAAPRPTAISPKPVRCRASGGVGRARPAGAAGSRGRRGG